MKISVVIPSHNRPEGVVRAVKSVLSQDMPPDEVIVVDDGSKIPLKKDDFPRLSSEAIVIVRNDVPKGAPYSRNRGVDVCKGDVVCFLDDDDVFRRQKLSLVSSAFSDSSIGVVTSFSKVNITDYALSYLVCPRPDKRMQMLKNVLGTTSMLCVRKDKFIEAGGFDEQLPARQDYELGIRLMGICDKVVCIPEILVDVNVELKSVSISKSMDKNLQALEYIDWKYVGELDQLTCFERKAREIEKNKFISHKMIISGNTMSAISTFLRGAAKFRSVSLLIAGLSLCLGRKRFFKILRVKNRL